MATTVRVRDEDKARLDALQAKYTLATGRRIALDELVGRLIELATEHEEELILDDEPPRLTRKQIHAFHAGTSDWGVTTTEDDVDTTLYGPEGPA